MAESTPPTSLSNESESDDYSVYSSEFVPTLLDQLKFECKSIIGRRLLRNPVAEYGRRARLLNLGCGLAYYPEFVNADFFRFRFSKEDKLFWGVDLRYPLSCPDDFWEGVYTEHTLEHLTPTQTLALLKEVYRTMKPGAWARIIVPDLSLYVAYYTRQPGVSVEFEKWNLRGAALRSLSQNFGHRALWDFELMSDCLRRAGFSRIERRSYREGQDMRLLKDSPSRVFESLYIEARKAPV